MFTVIALNVNSICTTKRKLLLNNFVKNNAADIFLFGETRLTKSSRFRHSGYKFIHNGNNKNSGGTAILINNNIRTKNIATRNDSDIEFTAVDALIGEKWCRIISVYVHCQSLKNDSQFEPNFTSNLPTIIGGDFNARNADWNDSASNGNGNTLSRLLIQSDFQVSPTPFPTCYRAEEGSYIDFFIHRNVEGLVLTGTTNLPSFSDHNAIRIAINNVASITISRTRKKIFNFTRIGPLNNFVGEQLDELELPLNRNIDNEAIDSYATNIEHIFKEAIDKFVPTEDDNHFEIRFSQNTRVLLAHSKRLQRRIHRNLLPNTGTNRAIHKELQLTQISLKNAVSLDLRNFYANRIADTDLHRNVHDTVNSCSGYRKKNRAISNMVDTEGNRLADNDIPELFAQHFCRNHNLTHDWPSDIEDTVSNVVNQSLANDEFKITFDDQITASISNAREQADVEARLPDSKRNRLTNTKEVMDVIRSRKVKKKSSGPDAFPLYLIQFLAFGIVNSLTTLFNHCIANGHFPAPWKVAIVIPIQKGNKDPKLIASHRPISLLASISKIFERILLIRMKRISDMTAFSNQFGFKNHCGTTQPLAIIHNAIAKGLNAGQFTTLVSLDIQSAFDSVWSKGLLYKLSLCGFDPFWIQMINGFLSKRKFSVRLGTAYSNSYEIMAGTPQGAILSPFLFNHYVADIPTGGFIKTSQYADDTAIYATHRDPIKIQNAINMHLQRLSVWFRRWKLRVNAGKTEAIHFVGIKSISAALRRKVKNIQFKLDGFTFGGGSGLRYLGMHFDKFFKYNLHIDTMIASAERVRGSLSGLIGSQLISPRLKCLLYKAYIRPVLTYASEIWAGSAGVTAHKFEQLRRFERKTIRRTTNTFRKRGCYRFAKNKILYEKAGMPRIDQFVAKNAINFIRRCENSPAQNINQIAVSNLNAQAKYKDAAHLRALFTCL